MNHFEASPPKVERILLDLEDIFEIPLVESEIRKVWKQAGIDFDIDKVLESYPIHHSRFSKEVLLVMALMKASGFVNEEILVFVQRSSSKSDPDWTFESELNIVKVIMSQKFSKDFLSWLKTSQEIKIKLLYNNIARHNLWKKIRSICESTGLNILELLKFTGRNHPKVPPNFSLKEAVELFDMALDDKKVTWEALLGKMALKKKISSGDLIIRLHHFFTKGAIDFVKRDRKKLDE